MLLFLFLFGLALGAESPSDDPQVKIQRGNLSHVLVQLQRPLPQVCLHSYDLGRCRAPVCVRESKPGVYPQSGGTGICQIPLWPCSDTHLDRTQWRAQRKQMDVVWWVCSGLSLLGCWRAKQRVGKGTLCSQQLWHIYEMERRRVFFYLFLRLCISHDLSWAIAIVTDVWFNLVTVHMSLFWHALDLANKRYKWHFHVRVKKSFHLSSFSWVLDI